MKNTIKLLLILLLISCSQEEEVMMVEERAVDWGVHSQTVALFDEPPSDDCYCKETSVVTSVLFSGEERMEVTVETPIGCAEAYDWVEISRVWYTDKEYIKTERKVECKPENEWFNYWDQGFVYDNEWFLCDYYVPYPFPEGDSHDNYRDNCLK